MNKNIKTKEQLLREIREMQSRISALESSAVEYRELFNNISSGVAIYQAVDNGNDFIFRDFNRAAEEIENIKKENVIGKHIIEAFPGTSEFGLIDILREVWRTGIPRHFPVSMYKDDRISGWRENFVYKLPGGDVVAIYNDITKQILREEELRKSRERLDLALKGADIGVWEWDIANNKWMFDNRWSEILGYMPDEIIKDWFNLIHPDDFKLIVDSIMSHVNGITPYFEVENRMLTKSGGWKWLLTKGRILEWDENGNPRRAAGTHANIDRKKNDEIEMRKLQQQMYMSARLSSVGQLAAGVAHEFNNILSVILGHAQVSLQVSSIPEIQKSLKEIEKMSKVGGALVKKLTAFAKPKEPRFKTREITKIIDSVIIKHAQQLLNENIEIEKNYQSHPQASVDSEQIEQVLSNLISNSIHAIKPKGKGIISVAVQEKDRRINIVFSDNGTGMDKITESRAFDPFFSTKGAWANDKLGIPGIGLGLPIALAIIKQHEGEITVQSKKNEGTVFTISLPADISASDGIKPANIIPAETGFVQNAKKRIMVIDDEIGMVELLKIVFTRAGYTDINIVYDVRKAVSAFKEFKPDIVFLDIVMPDIDGEEIFDRIHDLNSKTQIVFMSGKLDIDKNKYLQKGAFSFISKPFDLKDIYNILNTIQ